MKCGHTSIARRASISMPLLDRGAHKRPGERTTAEGPLQSER